MVVHKPVCIVSPNNVSIAKLLISMCFRSVRRGCRRPEDAEVLPVRRHCQHGFEDGEQRRRWESAARKFHSCINNMCVRVYVYMRTAPSRLFDDAARRDVCAGKTSPEKSARTSLRRMSFLSFTLFRGFEAEVCAPQCEKLSRYAVVFCWLSNRFSSITSRRMVKANEMTIFFSFSQWKNKDLNSL